MLPQFPMLISPHALVPERSPDNLSPVCQLQIEDYWDPSHFKKRADDPNLASAYRARLAYPAKDLEPGESASYTVLSYIGPKERKVLSEAGAGQTRLSELIDLGFFAVIAKVLVGFADRARRSAKLGPGHHHSYADGPHSTFSPRNSLDSQHGQDARTQAGA